MDFPLNILRRLFFSRPGLSSSYPMEASGSLVKTKQRQECWWGLHLYPGPFFALLHPRNLPEVPSVVGAFSSSLDVCGRNPAVARASKHLHFTPSVSVHTLTYLDWVFVTFSLWETIPRLCPLGQNWVTKRLFLYMPSLRWQQYHMHFALKLKLAFSITLLLPDCFDVCSKGQVCVSVSVCVYKCVCVCMC